ncbi:hypothetical protein A2477_04020 [Candidatus Falkowbacteria bacterium RIFOXYC2_FULL_47_12]|uniref:Glycosyltransferase RgtA/B/C/D-like domain-containing protein n=2 Tax=Candidatus Falkowiibacteriota TaxID=1752728 RepID=A0A1F5TNR1_9BACT|nr:MAG: hypothetical protein A2242_04620 [Candidatus Falkowbacteria bacterium RIFOXYA2_FULL_47_9]OGF40642.1 MAG: hypothetical protein A2477_04020 [Candidatus Falkowbacteria bacterium RIFOXYC2_FULL_47_12]
MKSMTLLQKYWPAVLLAFLVGLFSVLPVILSLQRMGANFQGIWPQFNSDANFYLARAHEVRDGHPDMNNPYLFEHKLDTYPQAIGGELLLAWLAPMLRVAIPTLQIALTFILPAFMAALLYVLLMSLYQNRASAFVLSLAFFTVVTGGMTKPIHPGVSFPLFLFFLWCWFQLVFKTERQWLHAILGGIVLGLLFLTYFFHWSFLVVVLGLYTLSLLWRKDYTQCKYHATLIVIALVIAAPYLLRIIAGVDTPFYDAMAVRMGVFATHWPETFPRLGVALSWLGVFVFLTRRYKLSNDNRIYVLLALLTSNVIYPNHQVITGVTIENATHWSFMPVFLYIFVAHYWFFTILKKTDGKRTRLDMALVVLIAVMLVVPAWRLQSFNFPPYQRGLAQPAVEERQQHYMYVFDWINANTAVDDVIFSHPALLRLVPVYTHANVYYSESMYYLLLSDTEAVERTLLSHFFDIDEFVANNFGMNEVARMLWTQPAMIERNVQRVPDFFHITSDKQYTLERELVKVQAVLSELKSEGWNISLLRRYRLDYIIWDRDVSPEWNLDNYDELEEVYRQNQIAIYKFKNR